VEQGTLTLRRPDGEQTIAVGSPAWFGWLETAAGFTFACAHGTFTARRERSSSGRGGWYWRAYQRHGGKLRRAYLGKAAELTLERLQTVAAQLAAAGEAEPAPDQAAAGEDMSRSVLRERQALPSGTVTFLFTDIVGSTQLWEQHHAAMGAALARHDTLLRRAIGAHGGVVFKTVGDSVYAVFARAPDALAAALDAQRALQQEPWDGAGWALVGDAGYHKDPVTANGISDALIRAARLTCPNHHAARIAKKRRVLLIKDSRRKRVEPL
jgi:class 3 adenylate cyclase